MAILSVGSLSKSFGERTLFSGVSFSVNEKEKIGFIGSNGAGKTTLFRIIAGYEDADEGTVTRASSLRVGYMEQYALKSSKTTLYDEVISVFDYIKKIDEDHKKVTKQIELGLSIPEYIEKQHALSQQFEDMGGLTYESRTRSVLLGLGFAEDDLTLPVSSLSGGEKTRAALAKLLLSDCNLLLLDEPTNHLDMSAISYLEDYLASYKGACIIISHDRYFLDRVTRKTFDLDNKRITVFDGSYSVYKEYKKNRLDVMQKHYENDMKEIRRIEGIIKQQRQWNREKNIKTAESKQKMLDRKLAALENPENTAEKIHMDFKTLRRSGNDCLFVSDLSKFFDGKCLFKNVSLNLHLGDMAFLLGGNGSGKSTILNIINGRAQADSGEIRFGAKIDTAYYEQHFSDLGEVNTVISEIRNKYPQMTDTEIRNRLAGFCFTGDDVFKEISALSGGERARLALLKLMLGRPNMLFLDEPTNHLDIASREALEEALLSYDGTALIVSHDRYFINRIATKIYYLSEDGAQEYTGNYDYYLEKSAQKCEIVQKHTAPKGNADYERDKRARAEKRKILKDIEKTETEIAYAESLLGDLKTELQSTGADYISAAELTDKIGREEEKLERLFGQWEELNLKMEKLMKTVGS